VSQALAFKSCLLLLEIYKVDVLEILWRLTLYTTIDRSEISNIHKINQTEQQTEEFQYYDAIARYVLSLQNF
jgi:hypothetical protein